jgi:hypothetical protein
VERQEVQHEIALLVLSRTTPRNHTCAPKMPIQAFSGLCPMLATAHKLDTRSRPLASCKE